MLLRGSLARVLIVAAVAALCGCGGQKRPNVVFVLVDALRADHVGAYGYTRMTTPHIDALARDALLYRNAYSTSTWTVPGVASLFTSTLPVVHRIDRPPERGDAFSVLDDAYVLANEALSEAGYVTGMVTTIGWVSPGAGYGQGVDEFVRVNRSDWFLMKRAEEFIAKHRDRPFHLYLHLIDMHDYYEPERILMQRGLLDADSPLLRLEGQTAEQSYKLLSGELSRDPGMKRKEIAALEAAYDAGLRETDTLIGRLVAYLEAQALLDDTIIVLTSDHGEQFLEHGALTHAGEAFYNEVLRIPFIIAGPGRFEGRTEIATPVSAIDIFPTLFALLGIETPSSFQGEAILEERAEDRAVVATSGRTWKVITSGWSYIAAENPPREELYALAQDPGERANLAASPEHAETLDDMRRRLTLRKQECQAHDYVRLLSTPGREDMSEEELETLRSLGYVDQAR